MQMNSMLQWPLKGMSPEEMIKIAMDDHYNILKTDAKITYGILLNLTQELSKDEYHRKIIQNVKHFVKRDIHMKMIWPEEKR